MLHQPNIPIVLTEDHSLALDALDFVFDVEDGFFKVLDVGVFILYTCPPQILHCVTDVVVTVA
jgi:hypothetical protein